VSVVDQTTGAPVAAAHAQPGARTRRGGRPPGLRDTWWRHVVALGAILFAIFPVAYVLSAAFNKVPSLSGAKLIPDGLTLHNFGILFHDESTHYLRWYVNTVALASAVAVVTVMLAACAAYAFSRFRFRGRRLGLLGLLLVQMFPQLLAVVAIYLIMLQSGKVFAFVGLNSLVALGLVYLGGVMGVNVWLMKGFLDSIPTELDESARVDGATPAQVFWGVVLPLAAPVLAVIALFSFIATINEFVIASVLLQGSEKFTLAVGLNNFITHEYAERWGPFTAGVLLSAVPVVLLFAFLQRFIVSGLTGGAVKG
jgi:arabinogalactan oligomer/maltooligosaccharide transport system permease protein